MVEPLLTPDLIEEGKALVEALDQGDASPDAAFWLYSSEVPGWKLVIGQVKVGPNGPREIYSAVQKTLQRLRNKIAHLSLEDIAVAKPDAPIIRLLSQAVSTGPELNGIRFTHNFINGILVEDAFIYRLKRPAGGKTTRAAG